MVQLNSIQERNFYQNLEYFITAILILANIAALSMHTTIEGQFQYLIALTTLNALIIILSIIHFIGLCCNKTTDEFDYKNFTVNNQSDDLFSTILTFFYIAFGSLYAGFDIGWIFQSTTQYKGLHLFLKSNQYPQIPQYIVCIIILISIGLIVLINYRLRLEKQGAKIITILLILCSLTALIMVIILHTTISKRSQNGITKISNPYWTTLLVSVILILITLIAIIILVLKNFRTIWWVTIALIIFVLFFIAFFSIVHNNYRKQIQRSKTSDCFRGLEDYSENSLKRWGCQQKYIRRYDDTLQNQCSMQYQALVWQQNLIKKYAANLKAPYLLACLNKKCCQNLVNVYGPLLIKLSITSISCVFFIIFLVLYTTGLAHRKWKFQRDMNWTELIVIGIVLLIMLIGIICIITLGDGSVPGDQIQIKRSQK